MKKIIWQENGTEPLVLECLNCKTTFKTNEYKEYNDSLDEEMVSDTCPTCNLIVNQPLLKKE